MKIIIEQETMENFVFPDEIITKYISSKNILKSFFLKQFFREIALKPHI